MIVPELPTVSIEKLSLNDELHTRSWSLFLERNDFEVYENSRMSCNKRRQIVMSLLSFSFLSKASFPSVSKESDSGVKHEATVKICFKVVTF